ncbi:aldehyde dehydrogenase family protein [Nocardia sp. NPDC058176]|uniref:aldehyde dehydrogenase family protein n=1 Tax=Nocardia sp. NPDC058176 TaxID=3346368 RepID=UPI0036D891C9
MSVALLRNYVDGRFVASMSTEASDLIDPVDERVVGRAPISTREDVAAAVAAASRAFLTWGKTTPAFRQSVLLKLADAIEAHSDGIVEAQCRNTGQPRAVVATEEVAMAVDQLRFFAGAARLLEGKAAGEYMEGFTSCVRREPIEVVGQVTPWNYPFMMAIWKIGPALAVSITGSVRAGIAVAAAAAEQVKRVHLELGGNAPALVFADADIDRAAGGIAEAAFFNAGQDCTAAARVLVHHSVHDQLVEALVKKAETLVPGPPRDPRAFYGPLNNIDHFTAVTDKLDALPSHARIVTGGKRVGDLGYFLEPTIVTGVGQHDEIVQQETFGPVLTVQAFTGESQAIHYANDVHYGLASSVWTRDHGTVERLTRALDFGAVWVNCHIPLFAEMPHGGFKYSGYGKDLSAYGVEEYTRIKHVMSSHD